METGEPFDPIGWPAYIINEFSVIFLEYEVLNPGSHAAR